MKNNNSISKKIVNLFTHSFRRYNMIMLLLLLSFTIIVSVTSHPFFLMVQIIELFLLMVNAVYIVYRIFLNRRLIFEENEKEV